MHNANDARYTDLGVARLACMSYSFGPDHAAIAGPAEAIALWTIIDGKPVRKN